MSDNNEKNTNESPSNLQKIKEKLQVIKEELAAIAPSEQSAENKEDDTITIPTSTPKETIVIPTNGKPVMPSQIVALQLKGEWEDTIAAVANTESKTFAIFSVKDKRKDTIQKDDLPKTGTLVRLLHAKSMPGEVHIVCEGLCRVEIKQWYSFAKSHLALVDYPQDIMPEAETDDDVKLKAYAMNIVSLLQDILPLSPLYSDEMRQYLLRFDQSDPSLLADCAASVSNADSKVLQDILETYDVLTRLEKSQKLLKKELKAAKLKENIKSSVSDRLTKRQKEFVLKEQLKEIQKELGTRADSSTEADEFVERMKKLNPPELVQKRFEKEIKKLNVLDNSSPEYAGTRNYLDILTTIPWGLEAHEELDLEKARGILDADHYGLKDVKDRIIEFLALASLKGTTDGSILLFVGPPGVGKTSIGKSIAKALNRPFYRLSLGGVGDDSVIKGHRKTYIGAMPGKFVEALRQTKVMNPVIMLDEIDKLTKSYQGDPASALLETLDPEQNNSFMDNFVDERIDLSKCVFICTANTTDTIPAALLDRMDPIRLSGYIDAEKFQIAKQHLLPDALEKAHLKKTQLKISDAVLKKLIEEYARESGMRSTQRAIDKLVRKAAVKLVSGQKSVNITAASLFDYLGNAPFKKEKHLDGVGVITGLAWTSLGGATLPIESSKVSDDQKGLELTGSLGDVMKESAHIAYSYVQSHLEKYNKAKKNFFNKATIHIHVPEGATPKDGPSAGVTIASSLLSLALNKAPKKGFAMTGELSLTGHVLAIGGIKEKTIAAVRMGITNIICPKANEDDVKELPKEVTDGVTYYFADTFDDVAKVIFGK